MKIYLSSEDVIELAYEFLDMSCPDPDKVHEIALKMDMVYDEGMDLYEDVEQHSIRGYKNEIKRQLSVIEHGRELFQIELRATNNALKDADKLRHDLNSLRLSISSNDGIINWANNNLGTHFTTPESN